MYRVDEDATHILLRLVPSLKPVGTIRVTQGTDYYKLGRLVVLSEYRKYKFGRKLVEAHKEWVRADAKARGLKETVIHCSSQLYVIPFYAKWVHSHVPSSLRRLTRRSHRFGYVEEVCGVHLWTGDTLTSIHS